MYYPLIFINIVHTYLIVNSHLFQTSIDTDQYLCYT